MFDFIKRISITAMDKKILENLKHGLSPEIAKNVITICKKYLTTSLGKRFIERTKLSPREAENFLLSMYMNMFMSLLPKPTIIVGIPMLVPTLFLVEWNQMDGFISYIIEERPDLLRADPDDENYSDFAQWCKTSAATVKLSHDNARGTSPVNFS